MTSDVMVREVLPADPRSARAARRAVRAVVDAHRPEWSERAELAVTEVVTNAVVHAGTDIELRVRLRPTSVRVEVADGASTAPARRDHSPTAATGRGLHLLGASVDRWDVEAHGDGKTVWFEIGDALPDLSEPDHAPPATSYDVVLAGVPALLHHAWQEHAAALLRDHLLAHLDTDPDVLEQHAAASQALTLLYDQLPSSGSAATLVLHVPEDTVGAFAVLDDLLERACTLGTTPPPRSEELCHWLCGEVRTQVAGGAPLAWS